MPWVKYDPIRAAATDATSPSTHLSAVNCSCAAAGQDAIGTISWSRIHCWQPAGDEPDLRRRLRSLPALRVVFVETRVHLVLPLMWRMDAICGAQILDGHQAKPSEYRNTHQFTTQPLGYPEDKRPSCGAGMDKNGISLMATTHWTFDDPRWLVKHLPEHAREAIMFRNGIETYRSCPRRCRCSRGQVRVFW